MLVQSKLRNSLQILKTKIQTKLGNFRKNFCCINTSTTGTSLNMLLQLPLETIFSCVILNFHKKQVFLAPFLPRHHQELTSVEHEGVGFN